MTKCQLDFYGVAIDYLASRGQRQRKFRALVLESSRWGLNPFAALGLDRPFAVVSYEPDCAKCGGHGFVEVYSQRPPAFEECDLCGNPSGRPLP